jgi:uncharacterized protein (TIGR02284 family)
MNVTQSSTILQDAEALQDVLTRYIDSRDGYQQAAELMPDIELTHTFLNIAERREKIAGRFAEMIQGDGKRPDVNGSPEAGIHRWWIRVRDTLAPDETHAIVEECLRGEKELSRTLQRALEGGYLSEDHMPLIEEALSEVNVAIQAFEVVAEN